MMPVNGLTLPASLERFVNRPDAAMISWLPKDDLDAYGNDLSGIVIEFFRDEQAIAAWTASLPNSLRISTETAEQVADRNAQAADRPGFIPWITDFSRIIQFARDPTGEPFCFDFRGDPRHPSIIYLNEWYWRRIAPDFDAFARLLEPYDGSVDLEERDYQIHRKRDPDY